MFITNDLARNAFAPYGMLHVSPEVGMYTLEISLGYKMVHENSTKVVYNYESSCNWIISRVLCISDNFIIEMIELF